MADETVVRRGHAEDLEPAFALWWRAESSRRHGPPPPVSVERVRGYARRAGAFLLVADSAGEVVSMALVTPASSRPAEVAVVQMVFVAPERWGEGIGGKLVAAALAKRFEKSHSFSDFTELMNRNGFFLWDILNVEGKRYVDAVFRR